MPNVLVRLLNSFSGIDELDYYGSRCNIEHQITIENVIMTFKCMKDKGHENNFDSERNWHRAEAFGMKFEWMR